MPSRPPLAADQDPAALVCRPVTPEDAPGLLDLFRRTFAADGTGARSLETWRWRFQAAPGGNQSCLAEDRATGTVIAHIGGTPHATLWDGHVRRTVECVDHMVDPAHRHGPGRVNVFARLKQCWYDAWCGRDASFLAWGFPSQALYRVGRRFAGYQLLRPVDVLVCRDAGLARLEVPGLVARREPRCPPDADALWAACAPDLAGAVVRDRAHLDWRYSDCPHQDYALVSARDARSGALRGLTVLRAGGLAPDVAMVMELLAPDADDEARLALLSAAARLALESGACALVAHAPEPGLPRRQLLDRGFTPHATDMIMTARSWDPAVGLDDVRQRFSLSFGDMDAW